MKVLYDIIIIGGGVTAFGTAMYAGRFQMKTLVIGETFGGTIILTDKVENYPGFISLTGTELAEKIQKHAEEYEIDTVEEKVTKVERSKIEGYDKACFKISTAQKSYHGKTVIFATGTEVRKLEVPGEEEFTNKGVHYCALCDGVFYKDKIIGIVGGSDSAAKEALLLTQWAKKVYIIYRGDKIRAEPVNLTKVLNHPKIEIINHTNVIEIKGNGTVNKVIFDKSYKGSKEFKLDGLFINIGHIPLSDLAKDVGVKVNKKDEIIIDKDSQTNVPGVFAAGDVVDTRFKQAITGVAEGVKAAYSAYQYVNEGDIIYPTTIK